MRRGRKNQQQEKVQFSEILRERKIKFQKDQRALDQLLQNRARKNQSKIINPQRFSQQQNNKKSLRQGSTSKEKIYEEQQSSQVIQQSLEQSAKFSQIRREYLLRQKAQNFIQRLKKQKQYNQGKFLFLRKKEQFRKQQEKIKLEEARKVISESYHRKRVNQIMTNIMVHEERISFRADQSTVRQMRKSNVRSNTQNAARYQSVRQSLQKNRNQLPKLNLPKKNMANLSLVN